MIIRLVFLCSINFQNLKFLKNLFSEQFSEFYLEKVLKISVKSMEYIIYKFYEKIEILENFGKIRKIGFKFYRKMIFIHYKIMNI